MTAAPFGAFKSLVTTTREGARALSELIRASAKASAQSTSTLMGVVGGFVGMAVAYALTFAAPISLPIVGPICTGLGIVLAILLHRGKGRMVFEQKLDQNRIAADEILARIKALPKNAPPPVRDELWNTYKTLNSMATMANTVPLVLPPASPPMAIASPATTATPLSSPAPGP
jgi:hypothetical protein